MGGPPLDRWPPVALVNSGDLGIECLLGRREAAKGFDAARGREDVGLAVTNQCLRLLRQRYDVVLLLLAAGGGDGPHIAPSVLELNLGRAHVGRLAAAHAGVEKQPHEARVALRQTVGSVERSPQVANFVVVEYSASRSLLGAGPGHAADDRRSK